MTNLIGLSTQREFIRDDIQVGIGIWWMKVRRFRKGLIDITLLLVFYCWQQRHQRPNQVTMCLDLLN